MSFATADNVLLWLNKSTSTELEDAQIEMILPLVDGVIQNYCGWQMLATEYTNKAYAGDGTANLSLGIWPINSVTSVTLDGVDITADVTNSPSDGILTYTTSTFTLASSTAGVVLVSFNAGYGYIDTSVTPHVTEPIPADLQYAAGHLAAVEVKRIVNEMLGIDEAKFQTADYKMSATDLPKLVTRVLDRYRMIKIY